MSRWWRCYADTHRNPKIAKLSDRDFRLWHHLLCIASENDGRIPPAEDLKHILRMRLDHCSEALRRFLMGGLIDRLDDGYTPRNWGERQYKSDTSTERVRKHREKCNVSGNVPETPPYTETETDVSEAKASAVDFVDPETVMWRHGRLYLQSQGIAPAQAGSLLGKWKRDHGAGRVIEALGKAQREGAIDCVSFITRCLGDNKRGGGYDPNVITV